MAEHRRRASDRHLIVARENWYRDLWLLAITVVVVATLAVSGRNQARNTAALCALRSDLQTRISTGETLLTAHPRGILGISAPTIRSSIANEEATVRALGPVACPAIHH